MQETYGALRRPWQDFYTSGKNRRFVLREEDFSQVRSLAVTQLPYLLRAPFIQNAAEQVPVGRRTHGMSQNSAHRVDILLCKLSAKVVKASFAYKPVVSPRAEAGKVDALAQRLNTPLRKLKTKPVGEKRLHLGQNSVGLCLVTNDENHVVHITDIALDLKNALDVVVKTVKIGMPNAF